MSQLTHEQQVLKMLQAILDALGDIENAILELPSRLPSRTPLDDDPKPRRKKA
jgi:hypothetical protein